MYKPIHGSTHERLHGYKAHGAISPNLKLRDMQYDLYIIRQCKVQAINERKRMKASTLQY